MAEIDVLWIDDEYFDKRRNLPLGDTLLLSFKDKGIKITPESSFEKGRETLENNQLKFHAVILNICNSHVSEGKPTDDFFDIRDKIKDLQKTNGGLPYYFVYSGVDLKRSGITIPKREPYWSEGIEFYDKNKDHELLIKDIIKAVGNSFRYQCECDYADVLEASRELFGEEGRKRLLNIICAIWEESKKKEQDSDKFNDLRKIFEDISITLKNKGYSYFKKTPSTKQSLNGLSFDIKHNDKDAPVYIQHAFNVALDETQKGSHLLDIIRDVENGFAPYLLRSCLFELLNCILWLKKWVDAQGSVPQQIIKQPNQKSTKLSRNDFDKKDYIVTFMDNFYCVGNKFILSNECKERKKVKASDKIQILEVDINDDIISKDNYPYIATDIDKIGTL